MVFESHLKSSWAQATTGALNEWLVSTTQKQLFFSSLSPPWRSQKLEPVSDKQGMGKRWHFPYLFSCLQKWGRGHKSHTLNQIKNVHYYMELEALIPNPTLCWQLTYLRILSTSGRGVASIVFFKVVIGRGKSSVHDCTSWVPFKVQIKYKQYADTGTGCSLLQIHTGECDIDLKDVNHFIYTYIFLHLTLHSKKIS